MEIAFYVVMGIFAATSLLHLLFCLLEKEKFRKATKPLTTFLLTTGILLLVIIYPEMPFPKHAIWIAGFFVTIGDIFTLKIKSRPLFITGSVFYAIGHILNAYVMITMLSYTIAWWVYLIIAIGTLLIALALYPATRRIFGRIAYAVNLYLGLNLINIAFAIMLLLDGKPIIAVMILIGYILYLVSGIILVYAAYGKDIRRRDFYIMLFLLSGQIMIMLGLVNTLLIISQ